MISFKKLLKNDESLAKWLRFKKRKPAYISLWLMLVIIFFSLTAEFWANSKPIVMKFNGNIYFPVFKTYHPEEFKLVDQMEVDYKDLKMTKDDWAIYPIIKWNPMESNKEIESYPGEPSKLNWMGTDDRGRDVLTRLLYGLRYSLIFSVLVWLITFFVGTVLGGLMGYLGGWTDLIGQRFVEILSTVPQFFLLIIIISIFKPSLFLLVILSSIFGWIGISYYMRGEFLKNRNKEYVEAARAMGAGPVRIFFKHILPNSLTPIITFSPFVLAGNIVALASLDYLGFGLTPPTPSWGELLNQAQKNFTTAWWLAVYPSLALFLTLTILSLIGEGAREALDPKES
jgi:microcin C transport system permease protein